MNRGNKIAITAMETLVKRVNETIEELKHCKEEDIEEIAFDLFEEDKLMANFIKLKDFVEEPR